MFYLPRIVFYDGLLCNIVMNRRNSKLFPPCTVPKIIWIKTMPVPVRYSTVYVWVLGQILYTVQCTLYTVQYGVYVNKNRIYSVASAPAVTSLIFYAGISIFLVWKVVSSYVKWPLTGMNEYVCICIAYTYICIGPVLCYPTILVPLQQFIRIVLTNTRTWKVTTRT